MRLAYSLAITLLASMAAYAQDSTPRELVVNVGKSLVLDSPVDIVRASVASPETLEVVAISPREVVLNGKKAGQTSLILWQKESGRLLFDVTVGTGPNTKLEMVKAQLEKEFGGADISIELDGSDVFLRGTVNDLTESDRAMTIASVLGKPVNLLKVSIAETEPQILLRVKFADVERAATHQLGFNLASTGATNTFGRITTGQFSPPTINANGDLTLSDALNILLIRPDLNLAATIRLLEQNRLVQILAEPNVLALNGKQASFLAGGEYPYPVVQGGAGLTAPAVTIQFREFGIRLSFKPQITSRGTIRLQVQPEVSALDFANGVTLQGFNVPGLSIRRVNTEIELEDKQSFAIAGLMDNRLQQTLSKVPGLGDIPLLGKLFQSRSREKNKTELLVLVTPEIVKPIPMGQPTPSIEFPKPFLEEGGTAVPRTPGTEVTGSSLKRPEIAPIPVEVLIDEKKREEETRTPGNAAPMMLIPATMGTPQQAQPYAPASSSTPTGGRQQ